MNNNKPDITAIIKERILRLNSLLFLAQYYNNNSQNARNTIPIDFCQNYILNHVFPRVLAKKDANDLAKNGIHFSYLEDMPDLIVSYYINYGNGKIDQVGNVFLDNVGISAEELHNAAARNILDKVGEDDIRLIFILKTTKEENNQKTDIDSVYNSIWIATLPDELPGAGILAGGQQMFQFLATTIGIQKYFFLPASIHQVLLIPDNGNIDYLVQMLKYFDGKIPYSDISVEERLSDKMYHYDYATGHITQRSLF